MKTFTTEELFDIRQKYEQAKDPIKQVPILADLYDCKPDDITYALGISDRAPKGKRGAKSRWTPELEAQLISLRRAGKTILKISRIMRLSHGNIENKLKEIAPGFIIPRNRRACAYPNLKRWMVSTGYTQTQLAKGISVSQSHMSLVMAGDRPLSETTRKRLSNLTGIPEEQLFAQKNPPPKERKTKNTHSE